MTNEPSAPEGPGSSLTPPTKKPDRPTAGGTPWLNVTRGNPTAEELAAVTAVVLALQGGTEAAPKRPATRLWARRAQLNLPPKPGAGAWRRARG